MNNKITPKINPSFGSIQRCCRLGVFSREIPARKLVEEAFNESAPLQKYCEENNVHMILYSDVLPNCKRNECAATLDLIKLFPKKEMNLWEKFLNIFKLKPKEAIVLRAYGNDNIMAQENLVESIKSIKTDNDLQRYISTAQYNPIAMEKCKTCGWNKIDSWA